MNKLTAQQLVNEWYEECKKNFELDKSSPSGLRWKIDKSNKVKAGDVAGSRYKKIYWKVRLNDQLYRVHHIVCALGDVDGWYEMMVGLRMDPRYMGLVTNHLRKDKFNAPEWLRVGTQRENSQDKEIHREGKLLGANYDKDKKKYRSTIRLQGKVTFLGLFMIPEEAHNAYKLALTMHEADFPVETIQETCREYVQTTREAYHD